MPRKKKGKTFGKPMKTRIFGGKRFTFQTRAFSSKKQGRILGKRWVDSGRAKKFRVIRDSLGLALYLRRTD